MVVYILYSDSIGQYYVGITADLEDRLKRHNSRRSKFTKRGAPWKVVKVIKVSDRSEALRLEAKIKSRGIQRWLDSNDL